MGQDKFEYDADRCSARRIIRFSSWSVTLRLRIRSKLVLAILVPLLVAASANLWFHFGSLRDDALAQMERFVLSIVETQAARFEARFQKLAQVARSRAATLGQTGPATTDHMFDLLEEDVSQDPLIFGACLAFEPGEVEAGKRLFAPYVHRSGAVNTRKLLGEDYDYDDGSWDWYSVPKNSGTGVWTEPFFDEGGGDIVMCTFASPILEGKRFIGVATVDVDLSRLQADLPTTPVPGYIGFVIFSRKGVLISSDEPELIMNVNLDDLSKGVPGVAEMAENMRRGEHGIRLLHDFPEPGDYFIAHTPIPATGWTLAAAIDKRRIMEPVYEELTRRAISALGMVALAVGAVLLLSLRITRPIQRLAGAVSRFSAGEDVAHLDDESRGDEIGDLARAFNIMTARLRNQIEQIKIQAAARQAVESELTLARDIQVSLLPRTFPPFPHRREFDLHALNAPARHIAGDFFDFLFIDEHSLLVVIADVSGKGIPAAMFMAVTRTLIRNLALSGLNPGEMVSRVNHLLIADNETGMFVTMIVGIYDVRSGLFRYANAAHPLPVRIGVDGRAAPTGESTGTVVGVLAEAEFADSELLLRPGETLFFHTDGVPEGRVKGGEFFGEHRLLGILAGGNARSVDELCQEVVEAVDRYQSRSLADDVTVLAIRRRI